jgi:hypothetical protein
MTELAAFDLPTPDPATLAPSTALDELETTTLITCTPWTPASPQRTAWAAPAGSVVRRRTAPAAPRSPALRLIGAGPAQRRCGRAGDRVV